MSGIQIHSEDPISPAKAAALPTSASSQPAAPSTTASDGYPPARSGAAAPTPTRTTDLTGSGPPAPQPGAIPAPPPPATTAKATLPPPPKVGEKPLPAGYYAPTQATPTATQPPLPQSSPPQLSQPPANTASHGIPPSSTTSTLTRPSFPIPAPLNTFPTSNSTESSGRVSLEHPPNYVQNPFASDMAPDQRFATQQQEQMNRSSAGSVLGYSENSRPVFEEESSWDVKKWAKDAGKQLSKVEGQIWESINGRK